MHLFLSRALVVALLATAAPVLAQPSPPPVVVQVPDGGASTAGRPAQEATTNFQVLETIPLDNPDGAIKANLGDLLRRSDAAGLERVQVTGRMRRSSQGGASLGQVMWTSVNIEIDGSQKTQPLNAPLRSAFRVSGEQLLAGTKIEARGDVEGLIAAARTLVDSTARKNRKEAKDTKPPAASPKTVTAAGGGGSTNDIARNWQPPMTTTSMTTTKEVAPREPILTTTTNGCAPRVDVQGGYVVVQSQLLADGATKEGCSDTSERIPIQKSYSGCSDLVTSSYAQPQYRLFWVAPSGITEYASDCQPDPDTKWEITVDTKACETGADLSSLAWVTRGQRVYTNRNNQRVVLSPCEVVGSTALQTGRDYAVCEAVVDKTRAVVEPAFKSWYVSPATQQQQYYTSCAPDPAKATAILKDFSACADKVGTETATRQFVNYYLDPDGKRVDLGACEEDFTNKYVIQITGAGCTDYVDSSKGTAYAQTRKFYFNATGAEVEVASCQPDTSASFAIQRDYPGCPVYVTEAGGFAQDQFKTYYLDRMNERQEVQPCQRDPDRFFVLKRDYTQCADKRDIPNRQAWAQFQVYYTNGAGEKKLVNETCQPEDPPFAMNEDVGVCSYLVDIEAMTAREQAQLYYLDRMNARTVVEDCRPTAKDAVPVVYTPDGCSLRHDFNVGKSFQQKRYVYDKGGEVVAASACADSTEFYVHELVENVCADLVLSDNSAVFKQIRRRITTLSGPTWITECEPSKEASGKTDVKTTVSGCESTFYHYIDAGQSFGAWRYYYQWPSSPATYLTSCQQSTDLYPHQVEQQEWQYDDPAKSAKPKTAIYIMPPIGRVEVSPAQVRDGAVAVAYVYVRSTETARPGSKYWVGCSAYQPTDKSDVYKRPDGTEIAYAVGPGTTAYVGDECTYTTEYQHLYAYTGINGGGTLYRANGTSVSYYNPVTTSRSDGPFVSGSGGDSGCPGPSIAWTNYQNDQSRTKVTYPNSGGVTYTSWSTYGSSVQSNGSAQGTFGYQCTAGN